MEAELKKDECQLKSLISILLLLAALGASAFSSEKWLAERGDDSDVMRLRTAYAECTKKIAEKLEAPAENVSIPIETFPNGTVKSRVTAARAHIFADTGFVWGEKVRVEQYLEDGTVHASLDAESCVVDRGTQSGWVAGDAKMTYGEASVKGRGVYFSLARQFIKIFSQSEIRVGHAKFDAGSLFK